jgi:hypothetical protein
MTDERRIEQQELGDLDVREEQAEEVKGGASPRLSTVTGSSRG